ncbi:MAG TPA: hypothetical protein VMW29_01675 [Candidatus Bathyarchaeia archaeon]|nr:hypothetical protein [Candidatus Bathyarchaeia archaeon]
MKPWEGRQNDPSSFLQENGLIIAATSEQALQTTYLLGQRGVLA